MSIGIPQLEIRHSTTSLRENLKCVVLTIKAINASIAEALADKLVDKQEVVEQLKINLASIVEHGKTIQKAIQDSEKRAENRFTLA